MEGTETARGESRRRGSSLPARGARGGRGEASYPRSLRWRRDCRDLTFRRTGRTRAAKLGSGIRRLADGVQAARWVSLLGVSVSVIEPWLDKRRRCVCIVPVVAPVVGETQHIRNRLDGPRGPWRQPGQVVRLPLEPGWLMREVFSVVTSRSADDVVPPRPGRSPGRTPGLAGASRVLRYGAHCGYCSVLRSSVPRTC